MLRNVVSNIQCQKYARKRYFENSGEDILSELISKRQKLMVNDGDSAQNKSQIENAHAIFTKALEKSLRLNLCSLKPYDVPAEYFTTDKAVPAQIKDLLALSRTFRSSQSRYIDAFTAMIYLEEAEQSKFLAQFNAKNVTLQYLGSGREFSIQKNTEISTLIDAVEESLVDSFTLKSNIFPTLSIAGQIKTSNKDFIFIQISETKDAKYLQNKCLIDVYDIHFNISSVNRVAYQQQHFALDWIVEHDLFDILINNPKYFYTGENLNDRKFNVQDYAFSGQLACDLNEEQKIAAINIVLAENRPLPYLLFGPAGTGKTRTLVAAIEEIVRSTDKSVLVCANSNSACDEITERLLNVLNCGEMFRIYAKSYDPRKIKERIRPVSNVLKDDFRFPSLDFLYKFRVVVCTLSTSGSLTRACEDLSFNSGHFSHVIIDESASTHETVTMIPIAGLCTSYGVVKSSIVLAGDPKQLDAVTKSGYAKKLGYNTSFMEQLFEKPLYQRNPKTGNYNEKYITQLVKNYRSHSAILRIPNILFYENKLQAKAPSDVTDWFIGSQLLPSKNFPIVFKSVQGFCKRSEKDFSLFNMKEVNVVIDCIQKLLSNVNKTKRCIQQTDIGVVTPYKLQCKVIAQACRRNRFNDITIGTAEVFQGQERPVMIVSTVRTGGQLGFVNEPRRLNVIITRAKSLLIIVGDRNTLCKDKNWNSLIKYCEQNNAIS